MQQMISEFPNVHWKDIKIINPKRHSDPAVVQEARLFPYYAGFSSSFAERLVVSMGLKSGATILDPWNGSGTTTRASCKHGVASIGTDINPVMVLVAKAAHVSPADLTSLEPLAHAISDAAQGGSQFSEVDPLRDWFVPSAALLIRRIDEEINRALVSHEHYVRLDSENGLQQVSSIAAFFYVALFRTVRRLVSRFVSSNPTWTRRPDAANRRRLKRDALVNAFIAEVRTMAASIPRANSLFSEEAVRTDIRLANAEVMPLSDASVDAVISSPPYCTRIDYAVATSVELAILRVGGELFDGLRRSMTGTSTVQGQVDAVDPAWGATCVEFLKEVRAHASRASSTYYFKNHVQYFRSVFLSLNEIGRVLKPGSPCVLVVQNSYYKEILNDVSRTFSEMAPNAGLTLARQEDFSTARSMVGMNPAAKKYLSKRSSVESVLCFEKAR